MYKRRHSTLHPSINPPPLKSPPNVIAVRHHRPSSPSMHLQLRILEARRKVLASPLPPRKHSPSTTIHKTSFHTIHPIHHQTNAFFIPPPPKSSPDKPNLNLVKSHTATNLSATKPHPPVTGAVTKPGRRPRLIAHWTEPMDRIIRKMLSKYGWGCWTRIASSGKLPPEYHRKMIANRAKALGLTPQMFGPQLVSATPRVAPRVRHSS